MATTHISAAEAARDFEVVLKRIQAGATPVIEDGSLPVAVVAPPEPRARLLSEVIAVFKQKEAAMGEVPVLTQELAEAVEERIRNRKPRDLSRWG
jgi:hypothetical protein